MDDLSVSNQLSAVSVEYVGGGEFVRECGRWTLRRGGAFVSWWAAPRVLCVEDVIRLAKMESDLVFGFAPAYFEVCGEAVAFVNDVERALWMFVHGGQLSAISGQQSEVSGSV